MKIAANTPVLISTTNGGATVVTLTEEWDNRGLTYGSATVVGDRFNIYGSARYTVAISGNRLVSVTPIPLVIP